MLDRAASRASRARFLMNGIIVLVAACGPSLSALPRFVESPPVGHRRFAVLRERDAHPFGMQTVVRFGRAGRSPD